MKISKVELRLVFATYYRISNRHFFQRQIEVGTLLDMYRGCVTKVIMENDKDEVGRNENGRTMLCCMVDMLSTLIDLSDNDFARDVKCIMVQNFVLECILDAMDKIEVSAIGTGLLVDLPAASFEIRILLY